MSIPNPRRWSRGSRWIRIDPHIHAPGTLRNDQFKGKDDAEKWALYLDAINNGKPPVGVLGITDYATLRSFRAGWGYWKAGKLPGVELLIANVELRLAIQAQKGAALNAHLLFGPVDEASLEVFESKLARLHFDGGEKFSCTDTDLKRLGRFFKRPATLEDHAALEVGSEQFKVEVSALKELQQDDWFRENVHIALPAGDDGLKGVGHEDAFRATREALFDLTDIVFSGNPKDRDFWLGLSHPEDFKARNYSRKPCIHGSDAHELDRVMRPAGDRLCFFKAIPTADGFRQILVEPERRVHIGPQTPHGPPLGEVISKVRFENAPWLKTPLLELNSGLVTVIGARGSGKTALADSIALAGAALHNRSDSASFLGRAGDLARGLLVELEWGDGTRTTATYPEPAGPGAEAEPRVQYLSQKFVESLCTPEGLTEPLLDELERIVFEHLPLDRRMETATFSELRDLLVAQPRSRREAALVRIAAETAVVAEQATKKARLPKLIEDRAELARQITTLSQQLSSFVVTGGEPTKKALAATNEMLDRLRKAIASAEQRSQRTGTALQEVKNIEVEFQARFSALARQFADVAALADWQSVAPTDLSEARALLTRKKQDADTLAAAYRDRGMVPDNKPLTVLVAEAEQLSKTLGLDAVAAKKRVTCETQLRNTELLLKKKDEEIDEANRTPERIAAATKTRLQAYAECVAAMDEEVNCLEGLYEPLRKRLEDPALLKLSFSVHRSVNLSAWLGRGEQLFDLRKRSPFPVGQGLTEVAHEVLLKAWQLGRQRTSAPPCRRSWRSTEANSRNSSFLA